MTKSVASAPVGGYLGIECGGTRSTALFEEAGSGRQSAWEGGASNLRLMTDARLIRHFRIIRGQFPLPTSLAIGMAGVRTPADRQRIEKIAAAVWPGVPCFTSHDLETAIAAAPQLTAGRPPKPVTRVLVLSGTGSCCLGRTARGKTIKIGGWGHLLGDKGSGYEIGLRALKAVVFYLDRDREWSLLGRNILRRLLLNEPNDLIDWVKEATKDQVAAVALEVFEAAEAGDRIASDILAGAAGSLSRDGVACARALARRGETVQFVFAGSVLLRQPRFLARVKREIRRLWPRALFTPLERPSVAGAVELARGLATRRTVKGLIPKQAAQEQWRGRVSDRPEEWIPVSREMSPTERRHPASMRLDRMPVREAIRLFLREDATLPGCVLRHEASIEKAVKCIVKAFKSGGSLFYVGAGTSGRLGVLDASECPPTFRTPPAMVQGIIAGGAEALWSSLEGAEDDADVGAQTVTFRGVGRKDVVVGIAASGRTPFVWGALAAAREAGATTVLLCCNPHLEIPVRIRPDVVIDLDLGPELLTGSTRLKSGTATKLVLNLLTTLSMVQMGKVAENLMIDLKPSNVKLRDRAVRIVRELTGAPEADIRSSLERNEWKVKDTWLELKGRRAKVRRGIHR